MNSFTLNAVAVWAVETVRAALGHGLTLVPWSYTDWSDHNPTVGWKFLHHAVEAFREFDLADADNPCGGTRWPWIDLQSQRWSHETYMIRVEADPNHFSLSLRLDQGGEYNPYTMVARVGYQDYDPGRFCLDNPTEVAKQFLTAQAARGEDAYYSHRAYYRAVTALDQVLPFPEWRQSSDLIRDGLGEFVEPEYRPEAQAKAWCDTHYAMEPGLLYNLPWTLGDTSVRSFDAAEATEGDVVYQSPRGWGRKSPECQAGLKEKYHVGVVKFDTDVDPNHQGPEWWWKNFQGTEWLS